MKRFIEEFYDNIKSVFERIQAGPLAGQLAFFFVLSVVPILTLIAYGASFINISMDLFKGSLERIFSQDIVSMLLPSIQPSKVDFKFLFFILCAFYIASNGAKSIIITSNTIYNIRDRNLIKRRIKALVMTFILVILFMFILIVPVFGNNILKAIEEINVSNKFYQNIYFVFNLLKGPVSWFIIFFIIKVIYTLAPDKRISSSYVNFGAVFTTFGWVLTTALYSTYISKFARYDLFYAGLSNIVILMLWVYLLAVIFVIGMAMNYREEEKILEKTGQIKINK